MSACAVSRVSSFARPCLCRRAGATPLPGTPPPAGPAAPRQRDIARATDPLGRAWYFYARTWDPLFLDPPVYMRVMTGIDVWVYGPIYLMLNYAFLRRRG